MLRCTAAVQTARTIATASSISVAQISRSLQRTGLHDNISHNARNAAHRTITIGGTLSSRHYATPSRPKKSDTGTAKTPRKSVNKTPTRLAGPKKTAASKKKSAKKPTKKSAKKTTTPKKILTEEEKEDKKVRAKLVKQKAEIRNLRVIALLKDEPKGSVKSAYTLFNKRYDGPVQGHTIADRVKAVIVAYKDLTPSDIEKLNHEVVKQKKEYQTAYASWVASLKPADVVAANNARRLLKRRNHLSQVSLIKDDRLPKRPITPYVHFAIERYASGDLRNIDVSDAGKLIGKEWNELSASQKQPYEDIYNADKKRYAREYTDVYGQAPPSRSTSPAAS